VNWISVCLIEFLPLRPTPVTASWEPVVVVGENYGRQMCSVAIRKINNCLLWWWPGDGVHVKSGVDNYKATTDEQLMEWIFLIFWFFGWFFCWVMSIINWYREVDQGVN
jgi:hypothetical protein